LARTWRAAETAHGLSSVPIRTVVLAKYGVTTLKGGAMHDKHNSTPSEVRPANVPPEVRPLKPQPEVRPPKPQPEVRPANLPSEHREERSLAATVVGAIAGGVAGGVTGGVASQVTGHLLGGPRPSDGQTPQSPKKEE
jgi:uncharacterized protein YcfJ